MSNREEHIAFGFIAGAGIYCLVKWLQKEPIEPVNALACGVLGAGVALIPDLLEPATSPTHRTFAHSAVTGGLVTYGAKKVWDSPDATPEQKAATISVAGAYLSHLLADSATPAGIPLV